MAPILTNQKISVAKPLQITLRPAKVSRANRPRGFCGADEPGTHPHLEAVSRPHPTENTL